MMKHSLISHELGHATYFFKVAGTKRAFIRQKDGGATLRSDNDSDHTDEQNGLSAVAAAVAGYFFEVGSALEKDGQIKPEHLIAMLTNSDLPIEARFGLDSRHVSDTDKEALSKIDLSSEAALKAAKCGALVALSLLKNESRINAAIECFDSGDDILLNENFITALCLHDTFLCHSGIGEIWLGSGQAIEAAKANSLVMAIKELEAA